MSPKKTLLLLVFAGAALLPGAGVFWFRSRAVPPSPELATPMLALDRLGALRNKPLFFTPPAAVFLKPDWPELRAVMSETGALPASPEATAREWEPITQDPGAWRALDRTRRFSALLLTGDPAALRPLLEHLRKAPDWTLTWLDHTSLIFERSPARAWTAKDLDSINARFASHSRAEQVAVRVQTAHRLTALDELQTANAVLREALRLDARSAPALTELACLQAVAGRWDDALAFADRAVSADRHYLPASAARASALYAFGKFSDALALTRKLVEAAPDDGETLELHARVTHAAHAFQEEIVALEKIVSIATAHRLPTGTWRVYLAQAYAADSRSDDALAQFEEALKEPNLTPGERAFAEKGIERIKSR